MEILVEVRVEKAPMFAAQVNLVFTEAVIIIKPQTKHFYLASLTYLFSPLQLGGSEDRLYPRPRQAAWQPF